MSWGSHSATEFDLSLDLLASLTHEVIVPAKSQKGGGVAPGGRGARQGAPSPLDSGNTGKACRMGTAFS